MFPRSRRSQQAPSAVSRSSQPVVSSPPFSAAAFLHASPERRVSQRQQRAAGDEAFRRWRRAAEIQKEQPARTSHLLLRCVSVLQCHACKWLGTPNTLQSGKEGGIQNGAASLSRTPRTPCNVAAARPQPARPLAKDAARSRRSQVQIQRRQACGGVFARR